jgi:hypothetical protein
MLTKNIKKRRKITFAQKKLVNKSNNTVYVCVCVIVSICLSHMALVVGLPETEE